MARSVQHDLYGVVGNPVTHSLSPVMMNAALRFLDVPAFYLAVESERFRDDATVLGEFGFRGLSVTVPFKEEALKISRCADAAAQRIGAVNTLKWTSGGWEGRNTDWIGAVRALEEAVDLHGRTVLVIGAGGAARGIVYGLVQKKASVVLANRTEQKAKHLAEHFHCRWVPLHCIKNVPATVIVHCTTGGMEGRGYAFPLEDVPFHPEGVVMDAVYVPLETEFLKRAKKAGARVVDGLSMLLYQGVEQLRWWLDRPIPEEVMRDALYEWIRKRKV